MKVIRHEATTGYAQDFTQSAGSAGMIQNPHHPFSITSLMSPYSVSMSV